MKLFSLGFISPIVLPAAGAYGACALGLAPVSTKAPLLPFERQLTRLALNAREDREAPKEPPFAASPEVFAAGARPTSVYWAATTGIRLTGMPSFKDSLTDQQIWEVSLLLANAAKLPQPIVAALQSAPKD